MNPLDPDRLLPPDPRTRDFARELYAGVANAPILSPHGHVDPRLLVDDEPFDNAADVFITHDHYVTRLLHASGVSLGELGLGSARVEPREVWRRLAENWNLFDGTASGYWLNEEFANVLGIQEDLSATTADSIFDEIGARLALPEYRPRALFGSFGIEFLATTDEPLDALDFHRKLEGSLPGRVAPTFRPDAFIDAHNPRFHENVARLLAETAQPTTFAGYLSGLEERRAYFKAHGAVSTDHGVVTPETLDLTHAEAELIFQRLQSGTASLQDRTAFSAHMLFQMARMSVGDGLVMTVHAGVFRNHSSETLQGYGPDTGHDIPVPTTFVRGLRPLLERFGLIKDFHLVLFAVDDTVYSRELAPLAGFYPSVYVGAPWWFLDAPHAIARFRSAVTETAGYYRTSGFIDDTRAFLSIPARHDTARRVDAAHLAQMVAEGRFSLNRAHQIASDLVDAIPRAVFKL